MSYFLPPSPFPLLSGGNEAKLHHFKCTVLTPTFSHDVFSDQNIVRHLRANLESSHAGRMESWCLWEGEVARLLRNLGKLEML